MCGVSGQGLVLVIISNPKALRLHVPIQYILDPYKVPIPFKA